MKAPGDLQPCMKLGSSSLAPAKLFFQLYCCFFRKKMSRRSDS